MPIYCEFASTDFESAQYFWLFFVFLGEVEFFGQVGFGQHGGEACLGKALNLHEARS